MLRGRTGTSGTEQRGLAMRTTLTIGGYVLALAFGVLSAHFVAFCMTVGR
jgi:hypothetical protein